MEFCFCGSCGCYLRPDQGRAVYQDGKTVLLCGECSERVAAADAVELFEKKYCLNEEKNISELNDGFPKT